MAIDCITTGYGPPAHEALAEAVVRGKGGDPLAPVTVVVPNHYVALAARRALGRREHNGTRGSLRLPSTRPTTSPSISEGLRWPPRGAGV